MRATAVGLLVALAASSDAVASAQARPSAEPPPAAAHDARGVVLGESGDLPAAEAAFREAIRIDPVFARAHFHLGVVLDRAGRTNEAIAAYQAAIRLAPAGMTEARYGLSLVCARLGDLDGAIRLQREVVEAVPGLADARYNLGLNLWNRYRRSSGPRQQRDLDEAEEQLRRSIALDSAQPRVHGALGQLLADRQNVDATVATLRRARELAPGDPAYAYDLGLALRLSGDLEGAEAQFRATLAAAPGHGQARRALGLVLRQKGDLEGAAVELRRSAALLPTDAQAHNVLGSVLLKLDDVEGALEAFRQATRLDPALTEARVNLAQALARAGRRDEARAEAAEVQRLKAEAAGVGRAMILLQTASAQLAQGEVGKAVVALREAVAANPGFAEAHYQLGVALRRAAAEQGEVEDAFLEAVRLDPGHARARYEIGLRLAARGDTDSGALQLRKAVELAPSLVEAHRALARLAAGAHDWPTAVAALQAALAWEPGHDRTRSDLETALRASRAPRR